MSADPFVTYPVEFSSLRGRINHSWLENTIINKKLDGILALWLDGRWQALDSGFGGMEDDAEKFGEIFIEAFSPARLVSLLSPLAALPDNMRHDLEDALDALYLADGAMARVAEEYKSALVELLDALAQLRKVWDLPRPNGETQVRETIAELIVAASELRKVIGRIPKGAVIF